jgi:5'-nucleotidase
MKILVTNDDGIEAPGIAELARVASRFGDVFVVAPERAHSGCGHQVTSDGVISIREVEASRWAIGGTPADCVRVGLSRLVTDADWVFAGINAGANLGVDVFMSGTVAAVREGALLGRPGIAFSHYRRAGGEFDWPVAGALLAELIEQLLARQLDEGEYWNVNLPNPESKGRRPEFVDCDAAAGHLQMKFEEHDSGVKYCGDYHARPGSPGNDVHVCYSGDVAVTRMGIWQIPASH